MRGFLQYVDDYQPDWRVVARVQTVSDESTEDGSNSTIFLHVMLERGYEVQSIKITSEHCGVAQQRRRIYFTFVLDISVGKIGCERQRWCFLPGLLVGLESHLPPPAISAVCSVSQ